MASSPARTGFLNSPTPLLKEANRQIGATGVKVPLPIVPALSPLTVTARVLPSATIM